MIKTNDKKRLYKEYCDYYDDNKNINIVQF